MRPFGACFVVFGNCFGSGLTIDVAFFGDLFEPRFLKKSLQIWGSAPGNARDATGAHGKFLTSIFKKNPIQCIGEQQKYKRGVTCIREE